MNEKNLVKMFQRILAKESVTQTSNFFEFGGDSLLATRVLSSIVREYGVELSLRDLYEAPTPDSLVERIQGKAG